ncbi:cystatin-B-like [Littorina saxatilis]|uniref:Cystatin domain-containing protein n=1 Tax=Littorina saxatilis TaxID=31220 RepID=A0AAN9BN91_9CAEN
MMCGGTTDAKDATAEIQAICEQIREDLEGKAGKKFSSYKAKQYKSQVVAGTNFFVKIEVDPDEHIHARIFRPLPGGGDVQLHSFQAGKKADEEIAYF